MTTNPGTLTLLAVLLTSCATQRDITLTPFPETHTEYTYHILLPKGTTGAVIFWYHSVELRDNIIYSSGYVPIRHGVVRTEAYFPSEGTYILVVLCQTPSGIKKMRYRYAVRQNPVSLR